MSRTITPLQMNIVGDDGEVKGQYSPETYAETVTTGSVKKSESLELPGTDPSETLTDTIAKVKLYLDNVSSIASEKREVVDSPDDNSSNIPSTRATASLKASLDAINAIVTKNKEDIATKAPIAHADAEKTYGGGTEDLYGHVKTTDKYVYTNEDETAPTAADSVAASPKAVADAYTALDTGKAPVSHASTDTKYGSASLIDYGHVKASDTYKVAIEDGDAEHGVVASQKAVNDMYKDLSSNQETGIVSRAPIMHADAERTYGAGTESLYGHVKISDNYDMENVETAGNAASGMAASLFALHRSNAALKAVVDTKLPSTHAAEKATAQKFSHVKLTDNYESSQGAAADGVGASSKALADSFAKLNASISAAQKSIVTLNSDIMSSMDTFATKINTHDTDIKSDISTLTSKLSTHDNDIKSAISKSEDTIENAIIGINNHITQQGTTLKDKMDAKGCVKSVQRNYIALTTNAFNNGHIISINAVNPKKCVFNLISWSWGDSLPVTIDIQEEYFIIKPANGYSYRGDISTEPFFTWQLIEFY